MRILITGATGYIGSKLVLALSQNREHEILTLNRDKAKADSLFVADNIKNISLEQARKEILLFEPQLVLHLAAFSTSKDDSESAHQLVESNIVFGVELLDILKECKSFKLFVNTGSFAEYRDGVEGGFSPAYLYTATKTAFRSILSYYAQAYDFKYVTLVLYSVYGGEDRSKKVIDYIYDSLDAAQPQDMTLGEQVLDFVHVDDVVAAYCQAVKQCDELAYHTTESFHIGTGQGRSIRQLAQLIEQRTGKKANINWGGRPYRRLDVMHAVAPIENNKILNWKSTINIDDNDPVRG